MLKRMGFVVRLGIFGGGMALSLCGGVLQEQGPYRWKEIGEVLHSAGLLVMLAGLVIFLLTRVSTTQDPRRLLSKRRFPRPRTSTILILNNTPVSEEQIRQLALWSKLEILSLENTPMSDRLIEYLTLLPKLQHLNLRGTQITDAAVIHLAGLTSLRRLLLEQTLVTPQGIATLRSRLPKCEIQS